MLRQCVRRRLLRLVCAASSLCRTHAASGERAEKLGVAAEERAAADGTHRLGDELWLGILRGA